MLADDFIVKKLKNKELHGLLCNKLSKRVDRFGYRVIGVGVDKETNEVIVQLNKETIVRLNSKTALANLANDDVFMADIFDEFNELKANKEPQKPNSFYYGYVALIKSLMFLTIRMVILSIVDCLSLRN
ncbi:hypothetical protein VN1269_09450 [Helicobacter pylori]|nr:hypothetical protein VN0264_08800 [Helicobacter pylori]GHR65391.1 hypothetical protein VN1269_09450 [Helicobacter pylori]GHS02959.1 hypothetical protein VN0759_08380 [Helicobacter pylori]